MLIPSVVGLICASMKIPNLILANIFQMNKNIIVGGGG